MQIQISKRSDPFFNKSIEEDMYRLRFQVFKERLGWEVPVIQDMEKDEFDECNPVYLLVKNNESSLAACWRLLPTLGPTMLNDTFPQLLHGKQMPKGENIWELSRFAVSKQSMGGFGFSALPIKMMQSIVKHADDQGITEYVTVTTVAVERMLRRLGIPCERFGEPMQIGIEKTVAFSIPMDERTHNSLFSDQTLTILDEMERRQKEQPTLKEAA